MIHTAEKSNHILTANKAVPTNTRDTMVDIHLNEIRQISPHTGSYTVEPFIVTTPLQ